MSTNPEIVHVIDENGFHTGWISKSSVNPYNISKVVLDAPPSDELAQYHAWRWVDFKWVQAKNYLGNIWYNPDNTMEIHAPKAFDDAPPSGWVWLPPGQTPTPSDSEILMRAKERAWGITKAQRDAKEFGPFTWGVHTFDGDANAQRRINLAVMDAQAAMQSGREWLIHWTLADNDVVTLSAHDMISVAMAMGANINQAHEWARAKRAQIEAATTVAEIDAITA